jgi:hypothetical protein
MEAKGDVSKLETRRDIKGRQQPARKPRDLKKEQRARAIRKLQNRDGLPSADELMNASDDKLEEIFSAQSMIDRLREEKRALEIKVAGLESEVEELRGRLKAGGDMSFPEFQIAIKKYEETVEVQRGIIARLENEKLRAGVGPPPADDGLDIPGFLDRTTQGAAS